LSRFINNELTLNNLEELEKLNGFKFNDLPLSRKRRFNRTSIKMIQLTEKANEKTRRDIFERLKYLNKINYIFSPKASEHFFKIFN
jgi:hypothetical protein